MSDEPPITGREFGHLQGKVEALSNIVATQTVAIDTLSREMHTMNNTLSEAKGGWQTLMWVGGSAGAIGSVITWFLTHLKTPTH